MSRSQGTSPWVWVGCGCLGLGILVIGGCLAMGWYGKSALEGYAENMKDPVARRARVLEILGAEELPEGYNAQMYFEMPFLFNMVLVSDGAAVDYEDSHRQGAEVGVEELGQNAFLYFELRDLGDARSDFERLLEGEETRSVDFDVDFHSEAILGRGELDVEGQHLRWVAHYGEYRDRGEDSKGIYTVMLVDCEDQSRVRVGFLWQQGAPPGGVEAPDVRGTPADEAKITEFMSHFRLCDAS